MFAFCFTFFLSSSFCELMHMQFYYVHKLSKFSIIHV